MTISPNKAADYVMQASRAKQAGRLVEARQLLERALGEDPDNAVALNSLGLMALAAGDVGRGLDLHKRATVADPAASPLWLNLAEAHRANGDADAEIVALDAALAIDPYLLPALLRKAQAWERFGNLVESARVYRALLAACPDQRGLAPSLRQALAHGEAVVRGQAEARASLKAGPLAEVHERYHDADFRRVQAYSEQIAGTRKVYHQQPIAGHFPYLPAIEFFDRACFPWFAELESGTSAIREDLLSLWAEDDKGFSPYVAFDATAPLNQWSELNNSPRWSAWFLWKDGMRQEANCARCPATAAILESLPLLDIPGKAPVAMFSILEPRTRIPPHTGSSNIRTTVHLPLVVPDSCGFRVGAETREWREGKAWAFDDTIEHEAWNESDKPRAILILDCWNPLLTEAERAALAILG